MDTRQILNKALAANTSNEMLAIIPTSVCWIPFNGDRANYSTILQSTNSMRALLECVTNGMDACTIRFAEQKGVALSNFSSPRMAASALAPEGKLPELVLCEIATPHKVKNSADFARSTVDVMDHGCGIPTKMFTKTILTLGRDNKLSHPALCGSHGVGAATALRFVDWDAGVTLIASRSSPTDRIGFTWIRYNPDGIKHGYWEYAADTQHAIFSTEARKVDWPKTIIIPKSIDEFPRGTLIRHMGYDLTEFHRIARNGESAFSGFQTYLFQPIYPVFVKHPGTNRRTVIGLARFFEDEAHCEYSSGGTTVAISNQKRNKEYGSVMISHYVLRPPGERKPGSGPSTSSYLVHPRKTVIFTINGQAHEEVSIGSVSAKLRDQFPMIGNDLVVHIDMDGLIRRYQNELLQASREHLVEGELQRLIYEAVEDVLSNDPYLDGIEQERKEAALKSAVKKETTKHFMDFAKHWFQTAFGTKLTTAGPGKNRVRVRNEPLAIKPITLNPKGPTMLQCRGVESTFSIRPGSTRALCFETNAPNGWKAPQVTLNPADSRGKCVHYKFASVLRDGRFRVIVSCDDNIPAPRKGERTHLDDEIFGEITIAFSEKLKVELCYEVRTEDPDTRKKPEQKKGAGGTQIGLIEPQVYAVNPTSESWGSFLHLENDPGDISTFAYQVTGSPDGKECSVYYSEVFPAFETMLRNCSAAEKNMRTKKYENLLRVMAISHMQTREQIPLNEEDTGRERAVRSARAEAACGACFQIQYGEGAETDTSPDN